MSENTTQVEPTVQVMPAPAAIDRPAGDVAISPGARMQARLLNAFSARANAIRRTGGTTTTRRAVISLRPPLSIVMG